jgi:YegS/Rv2252/BmrU family lipid kinase
MNARSFALIANPHAGRGAAVRVMAETAAALRDAGRPVRAELTTSIGHAVELAERASAAGEVTVAIGGDGILRAVAAGASRHSGTMGIMPCGRGNDFARMVGIGGAAGGVRAGVAILLSGTARAVDCVAVTPGLVSGATDLGHQIALGNLYLGFDSLSNELANSLPATLGPLTYTYPALRVAVTMRPLEFRLVIDGKPEAYTGSGVVIANSAFYGRGIRVAPTADVHDGLLDVIMFRQQDRRRRVAALLALRAGRHLGRSDVRHLQARHVQIQVEPALEAYSDGDPICRSPVTVWALPGAVALLLP